MTNRKTFDSPTVSRRAKSGRRAFLRKSGVAVSAALVPAAAAEALAGGEEHPTSEQPGLMKDIAAIRDLYRNYAAHLARGAFEDLEDLFTADGAVWLNGRCFAVREKGLRRLRGRQLDGVSSEQSGPETVQLRLLQDPAQPLYEIEVAADRQSARARFPCVAETAAPFVGNAPLVEMARLQGQHSETWWEGGVHEIDCVKTDAGWKIRRVAYRAADGRPDVEA